MTKLLILSLSQILKTQPERSVEAFAQKGKCRPAWISCALAYDLHGYNIYNLFLYILHPLLNYDYDKSIINSYKIGEIDELKFCRGVRDRLKLPNLTEEDIKEAFNAMCKIRTEDRESIEDFFKAAEQQGFKILFVNDTDRMQHQYNLQQLKDFGFDLKKNPNIKFANSFEENILGKAALVGKYIDLHSEHEFFKDITTVTSYHREINAESVAASLNIPNHQNVITSSDTVFSTLLQPAPNIIGASIRQRANENLLPSG